VLFMSVLWKDCTTRGATIGGFIGLTTAVVLTVLSKSVWTDVLGNGEAPFPYASPALFSMLAGFVSIWLISLVDKSPRARLDRAGFEAQEMRSETGIGAAAASGH
jgi:cation/acetate symporter